MSSLAILLALLVSSSSSSSTWTPKRVPDVVEANGLGQHYLVRDGVLYVRTPNDTDWRALPSPPEAKAPIVAVSADEDDFYVVVTSDGLLHAHFPCADGCEPSMIGRGHPAHPEEARSATKPKAAFSSSSFMTRWGLPFLEHRRRPLSLPFPIAQLRAGRIAFSQRHAHVAQYEEPSGRAVSFGRAGTSSLFVLDDTGTRILLADPWLPPDFSREIPTPTENGNKLVLASIAASASSIMAITVDGRVFTRFDDYDINGGTPFFVYSHKTPLDDAFASEPPASMASEAMTRLTPALPWREHAPLPGRASRRIAIVQNGVGNDARTMSVLGENNGVRGVFEKGIADDAWRFVASDEVVHDDEWLPAKAAPTIAAPKLSMGGWWRIESSQDRTQVWADTKDFWFHDEVAHVTLHTGEGDVVLKLQLADAWTLFAADNAADDDTAYRLLMATITTSSAKDAAIVKRVLGSTVADRLDVTFAFTIIANQHELVLVPVGHPGVGGPATNELVLRADPAMASTTVAPTTPYSRLAGDRCDKETLIAVDGLREAAVVKAERSELLALAIPPAAVVVDVLTVLTTVRFWSLHARYLEGFEQHLPSILTAQQWATRRWVASSAADYERVRRRLAACTAPATVR